MSAMITEVARFRPDDPDALVQASFACSICLHEPTIATVDHAFDGAAVACCCESCAATWTVLLTPEQGLRLQLRPPWQGMSTTLRHH